MKWIAFFLLFTFTAYASDKTEISLEPVPTITLPQEPIETPDVGGEK